MRSPLLIILLAYTLLFFAMPASAWDSRGHEQIADMAWTLLTPTARKRIGAILMSGDAQFRPASMSDHDVRAAFRIAATFPDVIERDRDTAYEPLIASMNARWSLEPIESRSESARCKTWHYYDTPIGLPAGAPSPAIRQSNAVTALNAALDGITTAKDPSLRCWWLYWIEHLVGDLHQPLHCVSNYRDDPDGDAGGNRFRLASGNLHSYWDAGITRASDSNATATEPSFEEITTRWLGEKELKSGGEAADLKAADWVKEGAKLAETEVYAGIKPHEPPSDGYAARCLNVCRRQAVLAAHRLAALLNARS